MTRFIPNPKMFFWSLQTILFCFFFRRLLQTSPTCVHISLTLCTHTKGIVTQRSHLSLIQKPRGLEGVLECFLLLLSFPGMGSPGSRAIPQLCSHTLSLTGSILPPLSLQRGASWEDADGGMKVTLPWNPRPGPRSSAQLSSWAFREVFPLPRVRGLRGNINIFLAATLPQAGMQQLNSSIPFIKSSPLAPFSPRSPHMVPGVVFQDVPFEWQLYGRAQKLY